MIRRLQDEDAQRLHQATLEVLERSGIRMLDEEARRVLARGGCVVDDSRVRFPPSVVEKALLVCPKEIVLHDQRGEPALRLTGRTAYFGNGSDLLFAIDHHSEVRRRAIREDMLGMIAVVDALEHMDFVMSGFLPSDVPVSLVEGTQMLAMLEGTDKPIVYVTTSVEHTKLCVEMAALKAGSEGALRQRPFAANYINISNPLRHNPESIRKLMWLAEKGLPAIYRPSIVTRGISTPITPAGFLVVNNAAGLAGLVLSQLVCEGSPYIRCGCAGGTFDMQTMVGLHAAPEVRGFNEDLAEWYHLPRFGIGGLTGSKCTDQQASFEAALTLFASALSGAQLIHDVGYMDNGTTGSLVQLVMCHEMIRWIRQYLRPLDISAETIAMEAITEVADRDGDFLQTDHTLLHCRDDEYPELVDRDTYEGWKAAGAESLAERARQQVDQILAARRAPCLSPEVRKRMEELVGSRG